ncbi:MULTISPECIES: hypothetical protein [unclassified Geodermatophilus]
MARNRACYRHTRVWMAACPECTAWHLPVQITARNAAAWQQSKRA